MADIKDMLNRYEFIESWVSDSSRGMRDGSIKDSLEIEVRYVLEERRDIFDVLSGPMHDDDDDDMAFLVVSSIRAAYEKIFVSQPTIFLFEQDTFDVSRERREKRRQVFEHLWDIDSFVDHLVDSVGRIGRPLDVFPNIDKTRKTFELITEDYVNGLVAAALEVPADSLDEEIRDLKLKKLI